MQRISDLQSLDLRPCCRMYFIVILRSIFVLVKRKIPPFFYRCCIFNSKNTYDITKLIWKLRMDRSIYYFFMLEYIAASLMILDYCFHELSPSAKWESLSPLSSTLWAQTDESVSAPHHRC